MNEPAWVLDEVVFTVHEEQLARHGGAHGFRDLGIVKSALARPRNLFHYEGCNDLPKLAAAYIFGIAKNHGFIDGNKRTALVTGDLFLMLNGYELVSSPVENVLTILAVADGSMTEEALASWIGENMRKRPGSE